MKGLKIYQFLFIVTGLLFFIENASAQYAAYSISVKGDTINGITKDGLRQGKWVIKVPELRGEPGYEEEGMYDKGAKEGVWRIYTLQGDLAGVENYKRGGKHGSQQYFNFIGELLREENWRGYDPDAPFDTVAVYGTGSNEIVEYKIVKAEQKFIAYK